MLGYINCNRYSGEVNRPFGISRITRYNVTMLSTPEVAPNQYTSFQAYDVGFGRGDPTPNVGCGHPWDHRSRLYPGAIYFSIPGACEKQEWGKKTAECRESQPGGQCPPGQQPQGVPGCTWTAQAIGSLDIDELSGVGDRAEFCKLGGKDWDKHTDSGTRMCFWDGLFDSQRCTERASRLNQMFILKYPKIPGDIPAPECS